MKSLSICFFAGFVLVLTGCAKGRPTAARAPDPVRVAIAPPAVKDGSLWQEDSSTTASLTADVKARSKGDIVTVLVVEKIDASHARKTTTSRNQSTDAAVTDVTVPGAGAVLGAVASAAGAKKDFKVGLSSKRSFDGGGTVTDSGTVSATLSMQVVDVLPNGNLVLMGSKEVTVSGEVQVVTVSGIARQKDVSPDNQLYSTQLAEARVHITGDGPLDEAQRRTLVGRLFDWVNLF